MNKIRYKIILRTYHFRVTSKGTKWETRKTIARNNKTNQELLLDPVKINQIFNKGEVFRMACLGFKNVKIIAMTTGTNDHGEHELTVTEVKEK